MRFWLVKIPKAATTHQSTQSEPKSTWKRPQSDFQSHDGPSSSGSSNSSQIFFLAPHSTLFSPGISLPWYPSRIRNWSLCSCPEWTAERPLCSSPISAFSGRNKAVSRIVGWSEIVSISQMRTCYLRHGLRCSEVAPACCWNEIAFLCHFGGRNCCCLLFIINVLL